jgi:hypothetical protein
MLATWDAGLGGLQFAANLEKTKTLFQKYLTQKEGWQNDSSGRA